MVNLVEVERNTTCHHIALQHFVSVPCGATFLKIFLSFFQCEWGKIEPPGDAVVQSTSVFDKAWFL